MSQKIETIFGANDQELIRSYQKQAQQQDRYIRKLEEGAEKSRRSQREQQSGIQQTVTAIGSMVAAYGGVQAVIGTITEANREMIQQANEVGKKYDEILRKLQVQAGLTDVQRRDAQQRISQTAERLAVPVEQATGAATQLVSSGFSSQEATGGSLDAFLKLLATTNQSGAEVNSADLAKSLSQFLAANALEKNEENVLGVGKRIQSLFQGTNLQLGGLTELAGVTGAIRDQTTVPEQLAATSTLVESFQAPQAATGLRNFVSILSGSKTNATVSENLGKLGLGSEDVDFVDENFSQVLDRLAGGLSGVAEEDRAGVMQKIFGREGTQFAQFLINERDSFNRNLALQEDDSSFNQALEASTTGRNAASVRQQVRRERFLLQNDQQQDLLTGELREEGRRIGSNEAEKMVRERLFQSLQYVGFDRDTALRSAVLPQNIGRFVTGNQTIDPDRILENLEARQQSATEYQDTTPDENASAQKVEVINQDNTRRRPVKPPSSTLSRGQ